MRTAHININCQKFSILIKQLNQIIIKFGISHGLESRESSIKLEFEKLR